MREAVQTVAVVEDDPDIAAILEHHLSRGGFRVVRYARGDTALAALRRQPPDLLLLDLMLPGLDGLELFRMLRRDPATAELPVVMLTARTDETDRVVGLELGADDYITKPFSPREVVLRVRAVLRRRAAAPAAEAPSTLDFGDLRIFPEAHRVEVGGGEVPLTATEFKLLLFLARRAGRVQPREELLTQVWGYTPGVDSRTVDTHIRRLRRKLGAAAGRIETVVGVGYRFRG
ncbi:MAG: DNA-binding response regulator [Acidobacteria bacterium]|nr:MAG: DNA-binding response regulator [Acidobacteriota bacterium]